MYSQISPLRVMLLWRIQWMVSYILFGQFLYCTYLIIILSHRNILSPVQSVSLFNYIAQTINSLIVLYLSVLYLITLAAPTYFILYNTFITGTGTCMFYTCWRGMYVQLRQSFEGHAALTHTMDGITSFEFISILYLSLKLFSQNFIFLAYFVSVIFCQSVLVFSLHINHPCHAYILYCVQYVCYWNRNVYVLYILEEDVCSTEVVH